jgi:hypothetical protein
MIRRFSSYIESIFIYAELSRTSLGRPKILVIVNILAHSSNVESFNLQLRPIGED